MRWLLLMMIALLTAACPKPSVGGGLCGEDSDCADGQTCLFDLDRDTSYCVRVCERDADCEAAQFCSRGTDTIESGATTRNLCVDRVRLCGEAEVCNGYDDDCNGTVDDNCGAITGCLDDASCGAFVCQAPLGATDTVCRAANADAPKVEGLMCSDGAECPNGDCSTGRCRSFCRPRDALACTSDEACARAVGPVAPPHNTCLPICDAPSDCAAPERCIWRDVFFGRGSPQNGVSHFFVCSTPGPARKALGEACTSNSPAGDDECAFGLCFGNICTRICDPGLTCGDVGAGFECNRETLLYGVEARFVVDICVRGDG